MSGEWFFFVKQKTAYELRISDWSSDVCSSDLKGRGETGLPTPSREPQGLRGGSGRGLQNFLALLPVAGAQFVRLKRIGHAKRFLRVAALVETVHRHMLDHIVRIDDEGGAISDAFILGDDAKRVGERSEEHTSELQSLMRTSYAVF